MARAIDKQTVLDLIIEAKRADPETGSFAEWLAEYLVEHSPTLTPPNELERAGLYGKYTVYKNKDGSPVADCFVLRPAKDPAAVAALRAYAAATDNAELAADIINWVGFEPNEPLTLEQLREMDGEPVWAELYLAWALVEVKQSGSVMFYGNSFSCSYSRTWHVYRFRPHHWPKETEDEK